MKTPLTSRFATAALLGLAVLCTPFHSVARASSPATQQQAPAWFGAALTGIDTGGPAGGAVRLDSVVEGGPAHRSGFQAGDVIVALDGGAPWETGAAAHAALITQLSEKGPGDSLSVRIHRRQVIWSDTAGAPMQAPQAALIEAELATGATEQFSVRAEIVVLELALVLGRRPEASGVAVRPSLELYASVPRAPFDLEVEIDAAVTSAGLQVETTDLFERLARLGEHADGSRFSIVPLVQREPFALPWIAESLGNELGRLANMDPVQMLPELAPRIAHMADWDPPAALPRGALPPGRGATLEEHFTWLEGRLALAAECVERGLVDLSSEDRNHVASHWMELANRFEDDIYLYNDPDSERAARNLKTVAIGERVQASEMLAAVDVFLACVDAEYLKRLAEAAYKAECDVWAVTVETHATPFGLIVIGGKGDGNHRMGSHGSDDGAEGVVALMLDLGGDDFYGGSIGTTVNQAGRPVIPVSVVIDLEGNDSYEAAQDGSIGAGVLGLGMVIDVEGNDSYIGRRWSQGVGFMGVGLVVDGEGDDRYHARSLAQGTAAWGVGGVFDKYGADRFYASRFAQGVGLAGGIGLLGNGWADDEYYCKGEWASGYGTPGVFEGWGQGCGVGFRGNASGGIGLLFDGAGEDRYEAGNFSQGGGYYFGFGGLFDRGTRGDLYIGSRYNQGFSAHQAVGYFHESGGDDTYLTRNAVVSGLAWDECVTVFLDDSGDDIYQGGGFSLGASAHNSVSVFWDKGGADQYGGVALGQALGNDYHGGTSLSYFLDSGAAKDSYEGEQHNDKSSQAPEHGFFIDR